MPLEQAVQVKRLGLPLSHEGHVVPGVVQHRGPAYERPRGTDLVRAGAEAWIYTERKGPKAGQPQETSYWSLPEAAWDARKISSASLNRRFSRQA